MKSVLRGSAAPCKTARAENRTIIKNLRSVYHIYLQKSSDKHAQIVQKTAALRAFFDVSALTVCPI
ncbi:MAG: hypothetical protein E7604_07195 [Ruminococcaceae bacterium]|nr:hypothetical protein [Oscillospiraceae bacterium]